MRSPSSSFVTALAGTALTDLAVLVTIHADTPIRRTRWATNLTFDSNTYYADGLEFGEIRQGIEGERPRVELSIQNVVHPTTAAARPWSTYVQSNQLNGLKVTITLVMVSLIADTDAKIEETNWYISGWTLDRQWIRFGLGSPHDALAFEVPRVPLGGQTCWWTYKRGPCNSTSSKKACDKTLASCAARFPAGNKLPFGPSYPLLTRITRGA